MSGLVLVTPNVEFEERVRKAFAGKLPDDARYWREGVLRDPARAVVEIANIGAQVIAVGPDLDIDSALEFTRVCDRLRPDISVVIVAEPSSELLRWALRAGARDVIAPTTPDAEIRSALQWAWEGATGRRTLLDGARKSETPSARVIAVLCPKGGVGKTTVSSNLAIGLAEVAPGEVVVVDLDLQFGDIASALQLSPERTFSDAARSASVLDVTNLKVFLTPHRKEFFALCAPISPTEADDLTPQHVHSVLQLLVESFKYVVIDTASGLDEAALVALEYATDLVIMSATDVPSVRATQKEVEALRMLGNTTQRWHLVLNRADARTGLSTADIESSIGLAVDVAIPSSRDVPISLNQGTPMVELDPRSPFSRAVAKLVSRLTPPVHAPTAENGSRTSRRRRQPAR
jgi:pilus assembly protein CpaE